MFEPISNRVHFPDIETAILKYWDKNDIFNKSLELRKDNEAFIFYDGPPFATGLPHYGHLLAGTIKDIIPRYQTMKGKYVERRFGWDCHGLPVEMEMQNELGLKSTADIQEYGIDKFNESCRSIVLRYTAEWERTVSRMGRWVDFKNDYKTMTIEFMESVWWVFKELFKKGLIYEGFKVCPYSWKAGTTLSNFEANLNYKDTQDPAITLKFKIVGKDNEYLTAWTTTPWTLISNLALCVNKDLDYLKIKDKNTNDIYYIGKSRISIYYKVESEYDILQELPGKDLVGLKYEPLFPYATNEVDIENCFSVFEDGYVTDDNGTGIVHLAPAYGEDDYRVCLKNNIPVFDAVDNDGNFKKVIDFIAGQNIKAADKDIIKSLKDKKNILKHETLQHSYPYCWRTDTPLIYKAISTWFVKVEDIKDKMIKNNQKIKWLPEHIKDGRFGKWLENARDWAISRNRFWGTPIPIWTSEDGDLKCFGSVKELAEASGENVTDLHKHLIDKIVLTIDGKKYSRVPDVLDCWFESGSMPYAQNHYPFENKEKFENNFPADFIAEGLDQTRGWFYTLLVLSTAIMDKPPFNNVIVNGLILAEDGKKMSKRLKNYPAPDYSIDTYGADALRLYMIGSPVVRGEFLKFSEAGIKDILKSIIIPLWNSFSFFVSYANIDNWSYTEYDIKDLKNPLDRWILSYMEGLVADITTHMDNYDLQKAVPPFITYIERLTNWYIRRSRRRFWKSENDNDKTQAYFTLFTVLNKLSLVIAPFMPFLAEKIYQVLNKTSTDSVHLKDYPISEVKHRDIELEEEMSLIENVVALGRSLRFANKLKIRQPLKTMTVISKNSEQVNWIKNNVNIIMDELNIKKISFSENETEFVELTSILNFQILGKILGNKVKNVSALVSRLSTKDISSFETSGKLDIELDDEKITLKEDDIIIRRQAKEGSLVANSKDITVIIDTELTKELIEEGIARDFVNKIQKHRKDIDLDYIDRIQIYYKADDDVVKAINTFKEYIQRETLATDISTTDHTEDEYQESSVNETKLLFKIIKI